METLTKQQLKVILQNAPQGSDPAKIIEALASKGYKMEGYNNQQDIQRQQQIQEQGAKANEFLAKSPLQQIFSKETAKELLPSTGKIAKDIVIDTPVKIAKSVASIPMNVASGGQKTLPSTYQSEAKQISGDIVEGKKPLSSILTPFLEVPLDVTGTVGLGIGAKQLGKTVLKEGIPLINKQIAKRQAERATKTLQEVDDLIGKVVQGTPQDIEIAKKSLSSIDTKDIKTYEDLSSAMDDKISSLSTKVDSMLESTPIVNKPLLLGDLENSIKVGNETVRHNFVEDALNQLKTFYSKTGNIQKEEAINQLITKGNTEGLTAKEINDIARLHGQDLNAYNASGELASGLSKQSAENTRQGVKTTARNIFGDKAVGIVDKEISNLYRTKSLVDDMVLNVNKLQQKIKERGFGEKVGRLVFKVVDTFTGGGLKGFVGATLPRGTGYKTLNALDLEEMLSKNLKQINKALNAKTEKSMIQILEGIINDVKNTPNKQGGFINIGGVKTSMIDEATKDELIKSIDYLRSGSVDNKIMEDTISRLAERYGISSNWSTNKIANAFQNLIEKTKTSELKTGRGLN